MRYLAVDMGRWSVKFLEFIREKKQIRIVNASEVRVNGDDPEHLLEKQVAHLAERLRRSGTDYRVLLQAPQEMVTSRYISLPVPSRKKAEMMLPFQLDDDLPFPTSNAHFVSSFNREGSSTNCVVAVTKREQFSEFYRLLRQRNSLPSLLSAELSFMRPFSSWVSTSTKDKKAGPLLQNSYVILDIGHTTSKSYFVHEGQLVANHISHVAGAAIDKAISEGYKISPEEASTYKQEKSFFLTESQYENVDNDQKEFAKLMRHAIWPLVLDIRRWDLGHRVQFGRPVDAIYLVGGTSNIKNMANFMTQALNIKCQSLDLRAAMAGGGIQSEGSASFGNCLVMAHSMLSKEQVPNFLRGEFTGEMGNLIPAHSSAFIFSRMAILALIFVFFSLSETVLLKKDRSAVNKTLRAHLKNPQLELTRKEQRRYNKRPEGLMNLLKKRNREIKKDITRALMASKLDASAILVALAQTIGENRAVTLSRFEANAEGAKAEFTGDSPDELKALRDRLDAGSVNLKHFDFQNNFKKLVVELGEM